MPANWNAGARLSWYGDFGYQSYFELIGLYPKLAEKLIAVGGARGYCQGRLIARAVEEGLYPHAVLLGEDICTQRGPMISLQLIRNHYAPALARGLEPLQRVGCRPVWHSDGDVRPMVDLLIDCGDRGVPGVPAGVRDDAGVPGHQARPKRPAAPDLRPHGGDHRAAVPERCRGERQSPIRGEYSRGRFDLVLFTSNTINPDVPLANIRAMAEAL